jgi:Flp pilus assembly protein TadB
VARPLGDQREHDQAQFAMIEHAAGAPAPVTATPVFMGMPAVAVVMGAVAEMPAMAAAAMAVVSVFVVPVGVVSMSMKHMLSSDWFDAV